MASTPIHRQWVGSRDETRNGDIQHLQPELDGEENNNKRRVGTFVLASQVKWDYANFNGSHPWFIYFIFWCLMIKKIKLNK